MTPTNIIQAALERDGFRPEVDPDGDISFKHEGLTFVVLLTEDDPEYYQVLLPNFWPLESEAERQVALHACDEINRAVKLVKLYTVEGNLFAGVESAYDTSEAFLAHLPQAVAYLQDAARMFRDAMQSAMGEVAQT